MSLVKKQKVEEEEEQIIKPEHITPTVDTSDWPLLLKNWDQREIFPEMVVKVLTCNENAF